MNYWLLQPYGRHLYWLFVLLGIAIFANVSQAQEPNVVDITIEGLARVEQEAALSKIKTRVGDKLNPADLSEDLKRVWQTEFFKDVRVEIEKVEGGVQVVFVVVEKPSIKEVKYEGNNELSNDDLKEVVDVKPNTILNVSQLKKNVEKIKDKYVEKGYYLAEVAFRIDPVDGSGHEVNIVFVITENAKVMVREFTLVGNHHLASRKIKDVLQTREGDELSFLTGSGTYKEEFFQTDLFRIQALYYDNGYVNVRVGQPLATMSSDRHFIDLMLNIEEGDKFDIGQISFSGDLELKDENGKILVDKTMLQDRLRIKTGEVFNRTKLFDDIQVLTDVYRDQGYAYANVTPNSSINPEKRLVDLDLEVERGDLVYIERIQIVGNTKTRDKVIRREMRLFEGEKFNATGLNESKARIYQLGHFETVNLATSRGSAPDQMVVTIEIKEKQTGTFNIGAGFSSVEKFIATAQVANNNFLGNGQLLSLSAQLSFGEFARQMATLQFWEPYLFDTQWSFGLNGYITQRYYPEFQRNANGFSPTFDYPVTPDLRLGAGYTLEWIQVESDPEYGPALADLGRGNGRNSAVSADISYDTRDNRLFPTRGHYHVFRVEVSDRYLGSSRGLEYQRLELFLRYYYPLPWSFVLKLNAELDMIFARGKQRVAISERYFPGGIYSVRGFEPRALGPTARVASKGDPASATSEFVVGGNKQSVFNIELEFNIIEQAGIKGVVFVDAGNAFDDDQGFFYLGTDRKSIPNAYLLHSNKRVDPPLGLYFSFGFGFRWFSPIGPLRFEWGVPITKRKPEDRNIVFEFTIGNMF